MTNGFTQFAADLILPSAIGSRRFGDIMAPFQRERFGRLSPSLLALARGDKPPIGRFWWEATKGCSKDTDLAVAIIWLMLFSNRPLTAQVGAADADQAMELRKAAEGIVHANPWLKGRVSIDKKEIKGTATGSHCEIIPADVAGSHGARPDVVIVNELSHITKQDFAENLLDNATKVPNGLVIIATNAGFAGTWQHRWREIARTNRHRWSFSQWAKPSPWIDPEEIEEAKLRNSATRVMRLFYGVWSSSGGDALDPEDIEAAVTLAGPMKRAEPGWSYLGGLDLGITRDHSAFVVLGCHYGFDRIALCDCKSWTPPRGGKVDLETVQQYILETHRRLPLRCLHFDPHQAVQMSQNLSRRGIQIEQMNFQGKSLDLMATAIISTFATRTIDLYDSQGGDLLIRDLQRLTLTEKSYGYKLESVRDADGHADRAIALAIALPAAIEMAHHRAYVDRQPPSCMEMPTQEPTRFGIRFDDNRHRRLA